MGGEGGEGVEGKSEGEVKKEGSGDEEKWKRRKGGVMVMGLW